MAKITRVLQKIFGLNAGINERSEFGSLAEGTPAYTTDALTIQNRAAFEGGWFDATLGNNSPAIQDRNALDNLITRQLAYLFQQGVSEWDGTTEYHIDGYVSSSGVLYKSLTNNNLNNTIPDPANWISLLDSLISGKGDLITSDGATSTVLSAGTNGDALIANSAVANGIEWAKMYNYVFTPPIAIISAGATTGTGAAIINFAESITFTTISTNPVEIIMSGSVTWDSNIGAVERDTNYSVDVEIYRDAVLIHRINVIRSVLRTSSTGGTVEYASLPTFMDNGAIGGLATPATYVYTFAIRASAGRVTAQTTGVGDTINFSAKQFS